jgi:two-component system, response regulator RegA
MAERPPRRTAGRVVVADPCQVASRRLADELCGRGFQVWTAVGVSQTVELANARNPDLLVLELILSDGTWRDVMSRVPARSAGRMLIVTSRGSIATAVSALRLGALNYLVKPVTADHVIRAAQPALADAADQTDEAAPLSLDRAIWELLCQAVETSGSIAGAARMLRLHPRSLRRMLQKNPPLR